MVEPTVEPDGLSPEVNSITLHLGDGRTVEVDTVGIDAIFFNRPAIVKFLVAMYMATGDEEKADKVRKEHDEASLGTARVLAKHNQFCGYNLIKL